MLRLTTRKSTGQQVIDILRDRLESTGSELAEARNRITELECAQSEANAAVVACCKSVYLLVHRLSNIDFISQLLKLRR